MDFDADLLTEALANRLRAIVPEGSHARAADGVLWYLANAGRSPGPLSNYHVGRSGTYVTDNLASCGDTAEERIAGVAAQALDELQDHVDEASHADGELRMILVKAQGVGLVDFAIIRTRTTPITKTWPSQNNVPRGYRCRRTRSTTRPPSR